jgi:hypothetical protein
VRSGRIGAAWPDGLERWARQRSGPRCSGGNRGEMTAPRCWCCSSGEALALQRACAERTGHPVCGERTAADAALCRPAGRDVPHPALTRARGRFNPPPWPEWRNGRRRGFKILRRKVCEFESRLGHHILPNVWWHPTVGVRCGRGLETGFWTGHALGAARATPLIRRSCDGDNQLPVVDQAFLDTIDAIRGTPEGQLWRRCGAKSGIG